MFEVPLWNWKKETNHGWILIECSYNAACFLLVIVTSGWINKALRRKGPRGDKLLIFFSSVKGNAICPHNKRGDLKVFHLYKRKTVLDHILFKKTDLLVYIIYLAKSASRASAYLWPWKHWGQSFRSWLACLAATLPVPTLHVCCPCGCWHKWLESCLVTHWPLTDHCWSCSMLSPWLTCWFGWPISSTAHSLPILSIKVYTYISFTVHVL